MFWRFSGCEGCAWRASISQPQPAERATPLGTPGLGDDALAAFGHEHRVNVQRPPPDPRARRREHDRAPAQRTGCVAGSARSAPRATASRAPRPRGERGEREHAERLETRRGPSCRSRGFLARTGNGCPWTCRSRASRTTRESATAPHVPGFHVFGIWRNAITARNNELDEDIYIGSSTARRRAGAPTRNNVPCARRTVVAEGIMLDADGEQQHRDDELRAPGGAAGIRGAARMITARRERDQLATLRVRRRISAARARQPPKRAPGERRARRARSSRPGPETLRGAAARGLACAHDALHERRRQVIAEHEQRHAQDEAAGPRGSPNPRARRSRSIAGALSDRRAAPTARAPPSRATPGIDPALPGRKCIVSAPRAARTILQPEEHERQHDAGRVASRRAAAARRASSAGTTCSTVALSSDSSSPRTPSAARPRRCCGPRPRARPRRASARS